MVEEQTVTLEKIDLLRERADISYADAEKLLAEAGGDVLQALILAEERGKERKEFVFTKGSELLERVKEIIRQGNVSKIRVKTGENVVLEIPITAGVVGALMAPTLALLGVVAALATNCSIEVERLNQHSGQEAGRANFTAAQQDFGAGFKGGTEVSPTAH